MQEEVAFTIAIIRHRFGHDAAHVASALLSTPKLTIANIVKATSLHPETVVTCLIAMMQHDVVSCQGPHDLSRPPKASLARGKNNANAAGAQVFADDGAAAPTGSAHQSIHDDPVLHLQPPHQYEVTTQPTHLGTPATMLFGNNASGFKPPVGIVLPTNTVHQSVLPLIRSVYEYEHMQEVVKQWFYSINVGMVRGLSRSSFYSGVVQEFISADARLVVDEFAFRGKLTVAKAVKCVAQRLVAEQDEVLRLAQKNEDGTDPEYTAAMFNAMNDEELRKLPIFAYNKARHLKTTKRDQGGVVEYLVDLAILRKCDEIELERYEAILPRVAAAFTQVFEFYLLCPSFGFVDMVQVNHANLVQNASFINGSLLIDKQHGNTLDAMGQLHELKEKQQREADEAGAMGEFEEMFSLENKKRKALSAVTTTLSGVAKKAQSAAASAKMTKKDESSDDDSLFSESDDESGSLFEDITTATKRQRLNANAASAAAATTTPAMSSHDMPFSMPEEYQVFILNHDRFSLFLRNEAMMEYVARKVCVTSGLIIGAIAFSTMKQENPSLNNEYNVDKIRACLNLYLKIKGRTIPAIQKMLQANPTFQRQEQTTEQVQNFPQITPQLTSLQSGIEFYSTRTITNEQIERAMLRLTVDNGNTLAKEKQFVFSLGGGTSHHLNNVLEALPAELLNTTTTATTTTTTTATPASKKIKQRLQPADTQMIYVIQYDVIVQAIRRDYVLTHLLTKYGPYAQRILNVLYDYPRLEEKQIADFSLTPKKGTKELLHTLLTGGYVELLEVPTSADRLNPAKSYYLWCVDYVHCGANLLKIFYKSYANTILRLDTEREKSSAFVDKMLLQKHLEVSDTERSYGKQYHIIFARFTHILMGQMKALLFFKDLCPR